MWCVKTGQRQGVFEKQEGDGYMAICQQVNFAVMGDRLALRYASGKLRGRPDINP